MIWERGVGLGRGPSNDDDGFFVSAELFLPGGPRRLLHYNVSSVI